MTRKPARGLFIVGTDTEVGKTYCTALIARSLAAAGHRVGVYKPVASGARPHDGALVSDDAMALWQAAGAPGSLAQVCPQVFAAPLAPNLAAAAEGKRVNSEMLRSGLQPWLDRSNIVLVEGVGGLMSPVSDDDLVAELAHDFGFPLIVVARNALGAINQVLQTLVAAATFRQGLTVAGIVLNRTTPCEDDPAIAGNRAELERWAVPPVLADVAHGADRFEPPVDWFALAGSRDEHTTV